MITLTAKNRFMSSLVVAFLTPLIPQTGEAAASFSSYATITYTISSLSNLTTANDFSGLNITGSFDLVSGQATEVIDGNGSVTLTPIDSAPASITPQVGSIFTRTFKLDGEASNGGEVLASYMTWSALGVENTSLTDSYDIGINLSYSLSANVSGDRAEDSAFSDVTLNYYNLDESFSGSEWMGAATPDLSSDYLQNSQVFSFNLEPESLENLYTETRIASGLQASPVPLPSALWLFGSAILALPGVRKLKNTL